jgi:hypothetical protein
MAMPAAAPTTANAGQQPRGHRQVHPKISLDCGECDRGLADLERGNHTGADEKQDNG